MKKSNLPALILFVCGLAFPAEAAELAYGVYERGFHAFDVDVQYELTDASYKVQAHSKSSGILGALSKSETFFYSVGRANGGEFLSDLFSYKHTTGQKEEFIAVEFKKDDEFSDYFSTLLSLAAWGEEPAIVKFKDEEREVSARLEFKGEVEPKAKIGADGSEQKWKHYVLSVESMDGPADGWFFKRFSKDKKPPLNLYFARIPGILEPVLAQADMDIGLGKLSMRLTGAAADSLEAPATDEEASEAIEEADEAVEAVEGAGEATVEVFEDTEDGGAIVEIQEQAPEASKFVEAPQKAGKPAEAAAPEAPKKKSWFGRLLFWRR